MLSAGFEAWKAVTAEMAECAPNFEAELDQDFRLKQPDAMATAEINRRLATDWPDIRARIVAVSRTAQQLHDVLRRAGAPTTPTELGWPPSFYSDAVRHARHIRDRWTFLDFAADIGTMSRAAA